MDANTATAILIVLNCFSAIALFLTVLISAIALVFTIREMRRATNATAFKAVYDILQTDDIRSARRLVLGSLAFKPFGSWTGEEKLIAEKVGSSFDSAAIMARNGLVSAEIVAENWSAIEPSWRVLSPLVKEYRTTRKFKRLWDDFEWLALKAKQYQDSPASKDFSDTSQQALAPA